QLALENIKTNQYDVLIVDYKMPEISGLEFLIEAKKLDAFKIKILLTAFAEKELLEETINSKLINKIVEKPIDMKNLLKIVEDEIGEFRKIEEKESEVDDIKNKYDLLIHGLKKSKDKIIGINKGLKDIFEQLKSFSKQSTNILIKGETGTGKELIAKTIHSLGSRKNKPFIKLNLLNLSEALFEMDFFGYKRTSEDDPKLERTGKFEIVQGGTIFIDDVLNLKPEIQGKLAKVIRDKEFNRCGDDALIKVDFRLICCTNNDLEKLVEDGSFSKELYDLMNETSINVPPLRERAEDIEDLIYYFIEKACKELGIKALHIDKTTLRKLKEYQWPGNIIELENAINRAVLLSVDRKTINLDCFEYLFKKGVGRKRYTEAIEIIRDEIIKNKTKMKKIEDDILRSVLDYFDDSILTAVAKTGISKNKFYRRIR
ncbi:MAG: hypothetical protein A2086_07655, partial [Spirochaetes bacterium GWD1_27_9]